MHSAQVRWIDIPHHVDSRGTLTVIEGSSLPFEIKRLFYLHQMPAASERGGHAHRSTQQLVVTLAGRFVLDVSDGTATRPFVIDNPNRGLYLPPMTWMRLHTFEPGTVVLMLCDRAHDPRQEIRDFEEFRRLKQ